MEIQNIAANLSNIKLDQFQIEQILDMVEEYIEANETASTPIIEHCPKCPEKHPKMIKAGHTKSGKQMYRCKSCNKRFVADTGQLTFYSHQSLSKWKVVLKDTLNGLALRETAFKIGVHYVTVFRMRHKLLHFIEMILANDSVGDIAEIDEKYILASHKGTKLEGVDPRKHGSIAPKPGITDILVCIMTVVSRGGNTFIHTYNTGRPTDVNGYEFCQHIDKESYCFTDGINIYDWSLKKRNCGVKHLKLDEYTKTDHLNTVNGLHSFIESKIIYYRNISTKYINRYNSLFMIQYNFRKLNISEKVTKLLGMLRQHQQYFYIRQLSKESIFKFSNSIFDL